MGQTSSQNDIDSQFGPDRDAFIPEMSFGPNPPRRGRFKHPVAALFHVIFKLLSILFYLFGGLFGHDFISITVGIILLVSMDFWVVKNVTGRLLVGLRWSNYIDDEGNSHWLYENKNIITEHRETTDPDGDNMSSMEEQANDKDEFKSADSSIFWTGLVVAPSMWTLFLLVSIFKLNIQWFMLVLLALVLSGSNLYGYLRCRISTSEIKSSVTQYVARQVFSNFLPGGGGNTPTSGKPLA